MATVDALAPFSGDALRPHAPVAVDGVAVSATLAPADAVSLAASLASAAELGLALLPRGAGTQPSFGNLPARADAFLSLEQLAGIETLDASEGVCRAGAGTPLALLREAVAEAGWELPLDDAGRGGSLGGALATAAAGPRAQGFGRPRDVVLGYEVALADGSVTHCGGRVVKNVTGYDLGKLYTGSLGRLGVIAAAWLRLRPRPEALRVLAGEVRDDAEAVRLGVALARRVTTRALLLSDAGAGLRPLIELAGDAASVARDASELEGEGFASAPAAELDAVAGQRFACGPDGLRFVVSCLPTRAAAALAALREADATLLALPGLQLVCARFEGAAAADPAACFAAAARAAAAGGGRFLCEAAPPAAKRGRDVFAVPEAELSLTRALVARFDPSGVLNPGRFAGGI